LVFFGLTRTWAGAYKPASRETGALVRRA